MQNVKLQNANLTDVFIPDKILLMRLTKKQRENLAKTFFILSHITFGGLIITQIAMRKEFDLLIFIILY